MKMSYQFIISYHNNSINNQ